jgi:polyhydroxybutyrate depolymerase
MKTVTLAATIFNFQLMKIIFLILSFIATCTGSYSQYITDSIKVDDQYRSFSYQALNSTQKGCTVIFILHGSGMTGKDMIPPSAGLQKIAATEHLLLVYPNGYKHYWNECRKGATSEANTLDINEQRFFDGMIKYLSARYDINTKSFFAIGLSGGGHMAYKLGMTMPERFKAVSAIVANLPDTNNLDCAEAKKPIAVMITNGTKDALNHYEGGNIIIDGKNWGAIRSTDRTFAYWATLAGYSGEPVVTALPDADTTNDQSITRYTYQQRDKPEVTLLKVNGGTHAFPKDIDIFLESWEFFKREIKREGRAMKE